jgi:hypothetical protein
VLRLGAEAKSRQLAVEDDAAAESRRRLAEEIRSGSLRYSLDLEAAAEVKHLGLIARYDHE